MAKKKKTTKELLEEAQRNNTPVHYVCQPAGLTFLKGGNLTLTKLNLIVELVDAIQDKVHVALDLNRKKDGFYGSFFSAEDIKGGYVNVDVRLSSLNIGTGHYADVEEAALALQNVKFAKEYIDEKGERRVSSIVLFPKVDMPKDYHDGYVRYDEKGEKKVGTGKRYKGYIRFGMVPDEVEELFSLKQYTRYLKEVASTLKSQYSLQIYEYISHYKDTGYWRVEYNELRRNLEVTAFYRKVAKGYEAADGKIITEVDPAKIEEETKDGMWVRVKYPNYAQFNQCVLKVAQGELEEKRNNNEIDCCFTYEKSKGKGRDGKMHEYIVFHIETTEIGRMITPEKGTSFQQQMMRRFRNELNISYSSAENLGKIILPEHEQVIEFAIDRAATNIAKLKNTAKKIKNEPLYYYKAIYNAVTDEIARAEEVKEEQPAKVAVTTENNETAITDEIKALFSGLENEFIHADWKGAMTLEKVTEESIILRWQARSYFESFVKEFGDTPIRKIMEGMGKTKVNFVYDI